MCETHYRFGISSRRRSGLWGRSTSWWPTIFLTLAVLDMDVEEWDRVIEINLRGTFLTCQAAARSMVAGKRPGKIITISSGAHASARPGGAPYCASKAGVVMFTKTLAMELAEARVNVTCIAPGYIQSEGAVSNSDFQRALLNNIPWGRFGTPADVAQLALFLASSAADYVTGEVFAVNGGAFAGRMYLPLIPRRPNDQGDRNWVGQRFTFESRRR
jgi:NAD(P)-dependent dehydrogenase (short-subunit alcohol dehydrogenase family)